MQTASIAAVMCLAKINRVAAEMCCAVDNDDMDAIMVAFREFGDLQGQLADCISAYCDAARFGTEGDLDDDEG